MRAATQIVELFGSETADLLSAAPILVVGAGGIGCELLKNLSVSGYRNIHALDLDTIDLSNLNRQFLFQRKHIRQPKAKVAIEAIKGFNPQINAQAIQANIKEPRFDRDWFSQFALVFNALDNLEARRHVNMMCLAAGVPLVESGTAGYLGQVTVIVGGKTECFDCQMKPAEQKTFPVCTIRSTPSAPIHCIVWAKNYLFAQLFGEALSGESQEDEEGEAGANGEDVAELKALREEATALKALTAAMAGDDFAQLVFEKVFTRDIHRLLTMKEMWAQRKPPVALDYNELSCDLCNIDDLSDHSKMTAAQSFALFTRSCRNLAKLHLEKGPLSFDKDEKDMLDFVAATASLRSHAFGIDQKSIFETKAMAGNIIPAIATTNAMVAGMMVLQSILVLTGRVKECHTAYLAYNSKLPRCIIRESLSKPNVHCAVCRRRYLTLRVADVQKTTLGDVLEHVRGLSGPHALGFESEDISIVEGSRILYDPDFEDNCSKSLKELGLETGAMLTLTSEDDEAIVPAVLSIAKWHASQEGAAAAVGLAIEGFEHIPEFAPLPQPRPAGVSEPDEDDDVELMVDSVDVPSTGTGKRGIDQVDLDTLNEMPRKLRSVTPDADKVTILD
ncbi:E1 ubiquitin-activating protein uba2 [Coemansia sp. Benny D115]|nr:E1 ubiquitin-activating protein uba2 [Coemansia sp. Benny D115]